MQDNVCGHTHTHTHSLTHALAHAHAHAHILRNRVLKNNTKCYFKMRFSLRQPQPKLICRMARLEQETGAENGGRRKIRTNHHAWSSKILDPTMRGFSDFQQSCTVT